MSASTTITAATPTAMPPVLRQHPTGWAGALPAADELLVVAALLARHQGSCDARHLAMLLGILGKAGHTVDRVALRWCGAPADLPDAGVWVDTTSSRLPDWLLPFGGQALVTFDQHGDPFRPGSAPSPCRCLRRRR